MRSQAGFLNNRSLDCLSDLLRKLLRKIEPRLGLLAQKPPALRIVFGQAP
jgi:hypothetical protein